MLARRRLARALPPCTPAVQAPYRVCGIALLILIEEGYAHEEFSDCRRRVDGRNRRSGPDRTGRARSAAPPAPMAHPMADKVMTRAEMVAMVREHFTQLDTNKDGTITTAEVD